MFRPWRLLALAVCVSACAHPVGPARTYGKYEGKAVTTAESALSSVESARLAVVAAVKHHAIGPYVSQVVGDAEDSISGVSGTFASIQPPDERADDLRDELGDLLSDAEDHVGALRIAVRRGEVEGLRDEAAPLADDADALRHFAEEHAS